MTVSKITILSTTRPRACKVPPLLKAGYTERGVSQIPLLKEACPQIEIVVIISEATSSTQIEARVYFFHVSYHSSPFMSMIALHILCSIHVEALLL